MPSFKHPFFRQQTAVQLYTSLLIPHTIFTLLNAPYQYPLPPKKTHTIEFRASRKVYYYYTSLKLNESHIIPLKNNQILVVPMIILKKSDVYFVVFASKMQSRGLIQTSDCILAAYCFFWWHFRPTYHCFHFYLFFLSFS